MTATLDALVNGMQTIAIVCNQWGDTGKGKFVDYFAENWADYIVRGTGSNNAGHTIKVGDEEHIFHLLPSGILHDKNGKVNVIGNGVLVNPAVLLHEIEVLRRARCSCKRLKLSGVATLTTPDDPLLEYFEERALSDAKVGTTMRGVGPGFARKIARKGVRVNDLFDKDTFVKHYRKKWQQSIEIIRKVYQAEEEQITAVLQGENFRKNNRFPIETFEFDAVVALYMGYAEKLEGFVANTQALLRQARHDGKKMLLEGAQGALLSIEHGTHPYVTSSDCSAAGLASGAGVPPQIDLVLGIVKMFYMTRVGGGPFPTEFIDENKIKTPIPHELGQRTLKEWEKMSYNLEETLRQIRAGKEALSRKKALSRYCRVEGEEYGATTGRMRRTGWLDLVAMQHALAVNGDIVVSTKTDVLDHLEKIKLCVAYKYTGPETRYNGRTLKSGAKIDFFPQCPRILNHCEPVYITRDGWQEETSGVRDYDDLPANKRKIFEEIEKRTGANIRVISIGAERSQTIIRPSWHLSSA